MTAFWKLAVRAVEARHDVALEHESRAFSASLIRSLIAANSEKQRVMDQQVRELSKLTFENATLREDNRLMVDAVVNWPHALDRTAPTPRVH